MFDPALGLISGNLVGEGNSPASVQALRQRMALALMMQKRKAPSTFGEGLSAIGEALGQQGLMQRLEGEAAAQSAATDAQIKAIPGVAAVPPATPPPVIPPTPPAAPVPGQVSDARPMFRPPRNTVGRPPVGDEITPNAENWNTFAQEESPGGLGLNQPQAAGLVGNLQAESTPNILPKGVVGDNGTAFGAAQWRGPRLAGLKQYAAERGIDPFTTEAQQGFARREMIGDANRGPSEGNAYAAVTAAGTPSQAATAVDEFYERSSGEHRGRRIANAKNIAATLPNPRDAVAATLASRPPPPGGGQDALLSEVTGMNQPAPPPAFAPTAGRVGDVQSDAPPVTGGLQGPLGQQVGDSVQQRQDTFQQPQPAVLPAGPQIAQAPQDPRAAIQKAPLAQPGEYVPRDRPQPTPPPKPAMGPFETKYGHMLNADIDARVKAAYQQRIDQEKAVIGAKYADEMDSHKTDVSAWLKEQEQNQLYRQRLPGDRATTRKTGLEADEKQIQLQGLPERLAQERKELEAKVGKAQAEAQVAKLNSDFQTRVGREREPFLKEFATEKERAEKVSGLLRSAHAVDEALKTGDVIWGSGADAKLALARIGSSLGNKRAAEIAAASEKYKQASDSTLSYGVMLVNGKDPRVTEGDVAQAKGLTGTLDMQRASQQRIINAMREDLHGKIAGYEDVREQYLRGDPQHRFFKVDAPPTAPQDQVDVLLKYRTDPQAIATFDRDHGPGAAMLEIKRAARREERAKKVSREDD
jgi:hypothetical protein